MEAQVAQLPAPSSSDLPEKEERGVWRQLRGHQTNALGCACPPQLGSLPGAFLFLDLDYSDQNLNPEFKSERF